MDRDSNDVWLQSFVAPDRGAGPACAGQTSSQHDQVQAQHPDLGCAPVQLQQDMVHGALFKVVLQQLGQSHLSNLVFLSCLVYDQSPTYSAMHNFTSKQQVSS